MMIRRRMTIILLLLLEPTPMIGVKRFAGSVHLFGEQVIPFVIMTEWRKSKQKINKRKCFSHFHFPSCIFILFIYLFIFDNITS